MRTRLSRVEIMAATGSCGHPAYTWRDGEQICGAVGQELGVVGVLVGHPPRAGMAENGHTRGTPAAVGLRCEISFDLSPSIGVSCGSTGLSHRFVGGFVSAICRFL